VKDDTDKERIKLFATYCNNMAVAMGAAGGLVPILGPTHQFNPWYVVMSAAASGLMHIVGRMVLGGLR
jgi:hypothetical protein